MNYIDNTDANSFFAQVYALVEQIPAGTVMTYGQIADILGGARSARYVGFAMSSAPEARGLPCHRVVNRKGEMAPGAVFGSPQRQRALLEAEGVPFRRDGRVDLALCRFEPPEAFPYISEQQSDE
jgi:O-6-methylguanine DNA methyltransferase